MKYAIDKISRSDRKLARIKFFIGWFLSLFLPTLLALQVIATSSYAALPPEQQNRILILNSYHPYYSWSDHEMEGIMGTLKQKKPGVEPLLEYLDCKFFAKMEHFGYVRDLYKYKFRNTRIPLVIVADNPALQFALTYRSELFPDAPIVFCGINGYTPEILQGQTNITGVAEILDAQRTVDVMLKLHPDTREIFVIHDYTSTGLATRRETQSQLQSLSNRVNIRYMDDLSTDQMIAEIRKLPKDALVLSLSYSRDREGRVFDHTQIARLLSDNSSVPVYGTHKERLGFGIVGGSLLSANTHGAKAAEMALEILGGKKIDYLPVLTVSTSQLIFDYKQLKRFNIDTSSLPLGSSVINRPVSIIDEYPGAFWSGIVTVIVLSTVIAFLFYISSVRKRAARALEEKTLELEQHVQERTRQLTESNRTLRDEITQRSQAQEEISWLNDDLQRRTQSLEYANNELEAFSYSVSHDLRAPLRHIEGFTRLLMEECEANLDEHGREYLNRVCKSTRRMSVLIDDLLNLSKVTRGGMNLQDIDITRLGNEVAADLRELYAGREVSFVIKEGMNARCDLHLMRIVLVNFLGNAWKYTSKNEKAAVEFSCSERDGEYVFSVKDNGVGFDMSYADRLFGTFQRLHHASEFEGTGIGLAIVRRIINRHEGRTWGEGQPGIGSTFYFTLPVQTPRDPFKECQLPLS
jgi:signal transduction histidine kinase